MKSNKLESNSQQNAGRPQHDLLAMAHTARILVQWHTISELQRYLLSLASNMLHVINLRDESGYTLLQYAVIADKPAVVKFLVRMGADINLPTCGLPLHLAAKLGRVEVVDLLLRLGADAGICGCVCYPEQHSNLKLVYSTQWCHWYGTCEGDSVSVFKNQYHYSAELVFDFPLYYALKMDNLQCVQLLLDCGVHQLNGPFPPLHLACRLGALNCVKYFLNLPGTHVATDHSYNGYGLQPIQLSVSWGRHLLEPLIARGASVMAKTASGETLLHVLFQKRTALYGLSDTVSYLLNCGLSVNINALDKSGNTCLHAFFLYIRSYLSESLKSSNVSAKLSSSTNEKRALLEAGTLETEIVRVTELLLQAGANPNILNRVGDTSLHVLGRTKCCCVDFHQAARDDVSQCRMRIMYNLLRLLFDAGAKASFVNNMEETPLGQFVIHGTSALFEETANKSPLPSAEEVSYFLDAVHLFRDYGSEFKRPTYVDTQCLLHVTLCHLDRLTFSNHTMYTVEEQLTFVRIYVDFVRQVLSCLLDCGVQPDDVSTPSGSDLQSLYYRLMAKCHVIPVDTIRDFVLLMLQHGADPNIGGCHVPMSVFRYRIIAASCPVYPLLHILNTIGSGEMAGKENELFCLLRIFYNAMDESNARQCLFHFLQYDQQKLQSESIADKGVEWAQSNPGKLHQEFHNFLVSVHNNPASLRRLSAYVVFVKLCRRSKVALKETGLPINLQKLLLSFNYF